MFLRLDVRETTTLCLAVMSRNVNIKKEDIVKQCKEVKLANGSSIKQLLLVKLQVNE